MPSGKLRPPLTVLILAPWLLAIACGSQPVAQPVSQLVQAGDKAPDAAMTGAVAQRLRRIAADGRLAGLRWPDFNDYRGHVQRLYEAVNYAPAWSRNGQPTPQALAVIAALENSRQKGLNAEDYDASRWPSRLAGLKDAGLNAGAVADFDAALTVAAMRYI